MHDLCVCVRVCVDPLYPAGWSLPHEAESRKLWLPSKFHIYGAKFEDVPSARCNYKPTATSSKLFFPHRGPGGHADGARCPSQDLRSSFTKRVR